MRAVFGFCALLHAVSAQYQDPLVELLATPSQFYYDSGPPSMAIGQPYAEQVFMSPPVAEPILVGSSMLARPPMIPAYRQDIGVYPPTVYAPPQPIRPTVLRQEAYAVPAMNPYPAQQVSYDPNAATAAYDDTSYVSPPVAYATPSVPYPKQVTYAAPAPTYASPTYASPVYSSPMQMMMDEGHDSVDDSPADDEVKSRRSNANVQSGIQQFGMGNTNLQGNIQQVGSGRRYSNVQSQIHGVGQVQGDQVQSFKRPPSNRIMTNFPSHVEPTRKQKDQKDLLKEIKSLNDALNGSILSDMKN